MTSTNPYYAALDLGSNSFHLTIVKNSENGLQSIDKVKHMVRLGEGLQSNGYLDEQAFTRGIKALKQMHQVLAPIPSDQIRTVATNTLRIAKNGAEFIAEGERALGHPIDLISGIEEARLIYLGITRHNHFTEPNLVIDVGGGSTEIIAGDGKQPIILRSLKMGCANLALKFFKKGKITHDNVNHAMAYAGQLIEPNIYELKHHPWQQVILSSGTAKTIKRLIEQSNPTHPVINRTTLQQLLNQLIDIGKSDKLAKKLDINEARAYGFSAGVCIFAALFEHLEIDKAIVSQEALREGVLLELIGRDSQSHIDERAHTIRAFQNRFNIDPAHAERVSLLAQHLHDQMPALIPSRFNKLLHSAAQLHEIGLSIARSAYYKHGAYILEHADMPGLSSLQQKAVSLIVKAQRKKIPQEELNALPPAIQSSVWQATLALRLAVLLYRSRAPIAPEHYPRISHKNNHIHLNFEPDFLNHRPLTLADLDDEQIFWQQSSPYQLSYST